ncbi:hypothetical protein F4819DRAFT_505031 [Hypoxylon fuscum]|nr:hypothetical protein F4819DRAFT_505031 [Hypoxylon fuscum]
MDNVKLATLNSPSTTTTTTTTTTRSRIPLSNKSNVTSPRYTPIVTRWDRKDSSEGQPSSHDSIFDAPWVSETSDFAKSPYQTPAPVPAPTPYTPARPSTPPSRPIPDPNSESPLSRLEAETPFLYGHGTELEPIVEQRSRSTLRTGGTLSTSDISSLLKHKASSNHSGSNKSNIITANGNGNGGTSLHRPLRRQNSFSLDALPASLLTRRRSSSKRSQTLSEPAGISSTSTSTSVDSNNNNNKNNHRNTTSRHLDARTPRLRSVCKRHSPPTVETVDVHAYPQKPAYPAHQGPPTPLGFGFGFGFGGGGDWLAHDAGDTSPYPPLGQGHASVFETPPFRGVRSGHGDLAAHPYVRGRAWPVEGGLLGTDGAAGNGNAGSNGNGGAYTREPGTRGLRVRGEVGDSLDPFAVVQYQPLQQRRPWTCKACGRPADQRWSLLSTFSGHGRGARRGEEWCTRCAWRKMVYLWCCCEQLG